MSKQLPLAMPERIIIEQMADPAGGYYEPYCRMTDGSLEFLRPVLIFPHPTDPKSSISREYFVAGLRTAIQASQMRWGNHVPVFLDRAPIKGHRPLLKISENAVVSA